METYRQIAIVNPYSQGCMYSRRQMARAPGGSGIIFSESRVSKSWVVRTQNEPNAIMCNLRKIYRSPKALEAFC